MSDQPGMMTDLNGNVVPIPQGATVGAPTQSAGTMTDLNGNVVPIPQGATIGTPTAPLTEKDAASGNFANAQAAKTVADVAGPPTHAYVPGKGILPIDQANQDKGVAAGLKRNTVDALTGMYHAFNDPATDQEKAEILEKVRRDNANGDKVPESIATNPSRATLALHRIVDAPAATLLKKGRDEVGVAKDLINNHEYWKGGNMYLSGLADKLLSVVPVAGPAINSIAERAESGDTTGAATDVASLVALEHAPELVRGGAKAVSKGVEVGGDVAGKVASKVVDTAGDLKPESLTKRPETPAAQHGTPARVESPLDGPTVGKQIGGKDLSADALKTLQDHVGDKIPAGSTAKNRLTAAVAPVQEAISEGVKKANKAVQDAPNFTTSVAQDNAFGEGTLHADLDEMKKGLPASDRVKLSADVDDVLEDADKALNSQDPAEVLEERRKLGNRIDWDAVEKNPSTPAEVQNAARARVYRSLTDKLHDEIPTTVEIDKDLQPNLELRSHMKAKLGERVLDDPAAATAEAQSEFKKGKTSVENDTHNTQVTKNWQRIKTTLITLGVGSGIISGIEHLIP